MPVRERYKATTCTNNCTDRETLYCKYNHVTLSRASNPVPNNKTLSSSIEFKFRHHDFANKYNQMTGKIESIKS